MNFLYTLTFFSQFLKFFFTKLSDWRQFRFSHHCVFFGLMHHFNFFFIYFDHFFLYKFFFYFFGLTNHFVYVLFWFLVNDHVSHWFVDIVCDLNVFSSFFSFEYSIDAWLLLHLHFDLTHTLSSFSCQNGYICFHSFCLIVDSFSCVYMCLYLCHSLIIGHTLISNILIFTLISLMYFHFFRSIIAFGFGIILYSFYIE